MLAACANDPGKASNVGEVAHITAAAPEGPRYDVSLSPEQRKAPENAIYLCATCADLIDKNNGVDHPVEVLRDWKDKHEHWTIERQNSIQDGRLKLVDLFVDNEGYKYPRLDVRILNLGDDPVMLTRGRVTTRKHIPLPSLASCFRLERTWSYDVEFGENEGDIREFGMSQVIPGGGADRFEIVLKGAWPVDDPALNLYELGIDLSQGAGTTRLVLPRVLIHMPCSDQRLASTDLPFSPEGYRNAVQSGKQLAQQLLNELAQPQTIYCDSLVVDALRDWANTHVDETENRQAVITFG